MFDERVNEHKHVHFNIEAKEMLEVKTLDK
jgi:hypothetical protein